MISRKAAPASDAGMTLVEILVTLVIMGILSGVAYIGLGQARTNSTQNACKTAYQGVVLAIAAYQSDNGGNLPTAITVPTGASTVGSLQGLSSGGTQYLSDGLVASFASNFSFVMGPASTNAPFTILVKDKNGTQVGTNAPTACTSLS